MHGDATLSMSFICHSERSEESECMVQCVREGQILRPDESGLRMTTLQSVQDLCRRV